MAEPLTRALTRAVRTVTAQVENVLRPDGLSLDQWLVLEALAEQRGLAMAELANRTSATGPTLTRVVDKLVSTALVYREVDPADRRRVRVYLSPRGRALHKRLAVKVADVERDLLAGAGTPTLDLLHRLADSRDRPLA
ncbi:MarR family winged helix-turn-helix transcriptional regulator [Actinokineospora sp. NPDC004072]